MQALAENVQQMMTKIADWCSERPDSEVDLAICPNQSPSAQTKLTRLRELETLLGKSLSLALVSADLDPVLGFEIVLDGRLIYEQQPDLWFKHRSQLWFAYPDSLPFRQEALRQLKQFAKEVGHGS
jgi:hypothetical protein